MNTSHRTKHNSPITRRTSHACHHCSHQEKAEEALPTISRSHLEATEDGKRNAMARPTSFEAIGKKLSKSGNGIEDDAMLGREPTPNEPCIKELIFSFLRTKQNRVDSGELSERSYRDYQKNVLAHQRRSSGFVSSTGDAQVLRTLRNLRDLHLSKSRSLATLGNEITRVQSACSSSASILDSCTALMVSRLFRKPSERGNPTKSGRSTNWNSERRFSPLLRFACCSPMPLQSSRR